MCPRLACALLVLLPYMAVFFSRQRHIAFARVWRLQVNCKGPYAVAYGTPHVGTR